MSNFANLKSRKNFDDLAKKLEQAAGTNKSYQDDRFWFPTKDKAKNGAALIRFLPEIEADKLPFVKTFSHSFKGPTGQWFIEDCPTTVGRKDCPACNANSELWNTGVEANKKIASSRKRKLYYVFNIYVVSDPSNKDAEGKVFLFKAGQKVFDKIMAKVKPEFPGQKPVIVWDLWEGANFWLRVKEVENFPNYDLSEFEPVSQLLPTDKELQKVFESQYNLDEFIDPVRFKTEDELQKQLNRALNIKGGSSTDQSTPSSPSAAERFAKADAKAGKTVSEKEAPSVNEPESSDEDAELAELMAKLQDDDE